jgi:methylation protein EvaC
MNKNFLSLGKQPLANNFKSKKVNTFYNLILKFDNKTKLVSINKRVGKEIMFNKTYPYRSSMSLSVQSHFKNLSKKIKKKYSPKKILEIGSNDGAFAKNFNKNQIVCVEPCYDVGVALRKKGFKVYIKYFDDNLIKQLTNHNNEYDLIFSANTITHIDNIEKVLKNIKNTLSIEGVFILEEPSLLECFKQNAFDQFYNEHIYVLSALSLSTILKKIGLKIFKIENLELHGGSLRYYIVHEKNKKYKISQSINNQIIAEMKAGLSKLSTYKKFAKNVQQIKKKLIRIFKIIKQKNKKIVGYGASAKSVTVLNYCNLKEDYFEYFLDTTKYKINKYLPGTGILVKKYQKKILDKNIYYFLGAWNFKKEIFLKERAIINKGAKFIMHLPTPHIFEKK